MMVFSAQLAERGDSYPSQFPKHSIYSLHSSYVAPCNLFQAILLQEMSTCTLSDCPSTLLFGADSRNWLNIKGIDKRMGGPLVLPLEITKERGVMQSPFQLCPCV
jgi:hypothetical protein